MGRKILAVIAGLVAAALMVGLVQKLGHLIYPLPAGADANDPETFKNYVENAPFLAVFFVIIAYAAGALAGGFVATKIARDSSRAPAFIVGSIMLLFSIYIMSIIPSPIWFWILGVAAWGLVLVGYRLALKKSM